MDLSDEAFRAAVNRNKAYILKLFGVTDFLAQLEEEEHLKAGDVLLGYCNGLFYGSYSDKTVVHIGENRDYVVVRLEDGRGRYDIYSGRADNLLQFLETDPDNG
jgi:hypothetical protein